MLRRLGIVARALARLVLAGAVTASLLTMVAVGVGPRTGRYQVLSVLTGSMRPAVSPGSLVVVAPKPLADLRVGDVLTYSIPVEDHHVVTHRVISVNGTGHSRVVRTKGDANDAPDPWVAELATPTVWTERVTIPYAGAMVVALRSPWAHGLGSYAVPFLLAFVVLRRIWGDSDQEAVGGLDEALA